MPFLGQWRAGHWFNLFVLLRRPGWFRRRSRSIAFTKDARDTALSRRRGAGEPRCRANESSSRTKNKRHPDGRRAFAAAQTIRKRRARAFSPANARAAIPINGHDGLGAPLNEPPTAADLAGFGSRAWLRGLHRSPADRDCRNTSAAPLSFIPRTARTKGKMVRYVLGDVPDFTPEETSASRENPRRAQLRGGACPRKRSPIAVTPPSSRKAKSSILDDALECADCHQFHNEDRGDGPDFTGYGSRAWLVGFPEEPGSRSLLRQEKRSHARLWQNRAASPPMSWICSSAGCGETRRNCYLTSWEMARILLSKAVPDVARVVLRKNQVGKKLVVAAGENRQANGIATLGFPAGDQTAVAPRGALDRPVRKELDDGLRCRRHPIPTARSCRKADVRGGARLSWVSRRRRLVDPEWRRAASRSFRPNWSFLEIRRWRPWCGFGRPVIPVECEQRLVTRGVQAPLSGGGVSASDRAVAAKMDGANSDGVSDPPPANHVRERGLFGGCAFRPRTTVLGEGSAPRQANEAERRARHRNAFMAKWRIPFQANWQCSQVPLFVGRKIWAYAPAFVRGASIERVVLYRWTAFTTLSPHLSSREY